MTARVPEALRECWVVLAAGKSCESCAFGGAQRVRAVCSEGACAHTLISLCSPACTASTTQPQLLAANLIDARLVLDAVRVVG